MKLLLRINTKLVIIFKWSYEGYENCIPLSYIANVERNITHRQKIGGVQFRINIDFTRS